MRGGRPKDLAKAKWSAAIKGATDKAMDAKTAMNKSVMRAVEAKDLGITGAIKKTEDIIKTENKRDRGAELKDMIEDERSKSPKLQQIKADPSKTKMFGQKKNIYGKMHAFFLKITAFTLGLMARIKALNKLYSNATTVLYIPRVIFAIIIGLLVLSSLINNIIKWFGGDGYDLTSSIGPDAFFWMYSICKLIFTVMMVVAGIFAIAEVSGIYKDRVKEGKNIPFQILMAFGTLSIIPYLYDGVALVLLIGILKAYYIQSCGSKHPNEWVGVTALNQSFVLAAGICFVVGYFIYKMKWGPEKSAVFTAILAGSVIHIIATGLISYIENIVAHTYADAMSLTSNDPSKLSGEDCQGSHKIESDADLGFKKAMNILMTIIITMLTVIVCSIQIIPLFGMPGINANIRKTILLMLDKVIETLK
tara:strand:+ start:1381 stop:2640 length:1260 start_codon:yes stop_codon:yes gene_type:complete